MLCSLLRLKYSSVSLFIVSDGLYGLLILIRELYGPLSMYVSWLNESSGRFSFKYSHNWIVFLFDQIVSPFSFVSCSTVVYSCSSFGRIAPRSRNSFLMDIVFFLFLAECFWIAFYVC